MTISIGVIMMQGKSEGDIDALLKTADRALYQAKEQGEIVSLWHDVSHITPKRKKGKKGR